MKTISLLRELELDIQELNKKCLDLSERNNDFFKIMATVKNDLEKTLKKPEILKETVYNCINLLRENTPYYSATEGHSKTDPPLTNEQKTL